VIGGGQSGLDVAARLKMLGMKTLVVEKNERIGDNWRKRNAALCLHDHVCKPITLSQYYVCFLLNDPPMHRV
jgi:cation diffusion facilitator CzcD-associated flavoprotein CzcO